MKPRMMNDTIRQLQLRERRKTWWEIVKMELVTLAFLAGCVLVLMAAWNLAL
jgi:hypothetical protein